MRVAGYRDVVDDIVDCQPDRDQIGVGVERDRQLDTYCLVGGNAWNTKVDQLHAGTKHRGQIGRPVFRSWVVGSDAERIRCSYGDVGQTRMGGLLYRNPSGTGAEGLRTTAD